MRKVFSIFILGFAFSSPVRTFASAQTFRYRTFISSSASCQAVAQKIGQRFTLQTGLHVLSFACTRAEKGSSDSGDLMSLDLIYSAKQEINPISMVFGVLALPSDTVGVPIDTNGPYRNLAACENDIATQEMNFYRLEGEAPVAAFCEKASAIVENYVLRLDTFHAIRKQLFLLSAFNGSVTQSKILEVQRLLNSVGGQIAKVFGNSVYFYDNRSGGLDWSAQHVHFKNEVVGAYASSQECSAEIEVFKSALQTANVKALAACSKSTDGLGGSLLEYLRATEHALGISPSNEAYASIAECQQDKARVLSNANKQGLKPLNAICSVANLDAYQVSLLFKN